MEPEEIGVAIRAFMAESCPSCGGEKLHVKDPFCTACFGVLPPEMQLQITDRTQFIREFHPTMEYLKGRSSSNGRRGRRSNGSGRKHT